MDTEMEEEPSLEQQLLFFTNPKKDKSPVKNKPYYLLHLLQETQTAPLLSEDNNQELLEMLNPGMFIPKLYDLSLGRADQEWTCLHYLAATNVHEYVGMYMIQEIQEMLERRNKEQEARYWLELAKKQFYEDKVEWREAMVSLEKSIKIKPTAEAYTIRSLVSEYL